MSEDKPQKPTILIVDDVSTNIIVLTAVLKNDYKIEVATSGQQCLDIAAEKDVIDLILLDIGMPEMDGIETCRQLKNSKYTADIPVIFVTARDGVSDEKEGFQIGAVDYITKPINPTIVSARVKTHITIKQQRDELTRMATHDQLTGLHNRHYLVGVADQKISQSRRHQTDLSLLMMDIDHFKNINDSHGHHKGDLVLKEVSRFLRHNCRDEDIVARFGGEEFVMLLEHCDVRHALSKAEKIRAGIEKLNPEGIKVTLSIGLSEINMANVSFTEFLNQADDALYKAKNNGRNCVVAHLD